MSPVTVEDYYKINTFITLVEAVILDFNQRFDKNTIYKEIIL